MSISRLEEHGTLAALEGHRGNPRPVQRTLGWIEQPAQIQLQDYLRDTLLPAGTPLTSETLRNADVATLAHYIGLLYNEDSDQANDVLDNVWTQNFERVSGFEGIASIEPQPPSTFYAKIIAARTATAPDDPILGDEVINALGEIAAALLPYFQGMQIVGITDIDGENFQQTIQNAIQDPRRVFLEPRFNPLDFHTKLTRVFELIAKAKTQASQPIQKPCHPARLLTLIMHERISRDGGDSKEAESEAVKAACRFHVVIESKNVTSGEGGMMGAVRVVRGETAEHALTSYACLRGLKPDSTAEKIKAQLERYAPSVLILLGRSLELDAHHVKQGERLALQTFIWHVEDVIAEQIAQRALQHNETVHTPFHEGATVAIAGYRAILRKHTDERSGELLEPAKIQKALRELPAASAPGAEETAHGTGLVEGILGAGKATLTHFARMKLFRGFLKSPVAPAAEAAAAAGAKAAAGAAKKPH